MIFVVCIFEGLALGIRERKEREKERRRREIQAAAKRIFLLKGFNSATVEDIADKAELSPATIYSYFKNKQELFASLILIPLNYLFEQTRKVYENDSLSAEKKILKFKDAMYKTFQYDQLLLRNIFHFQVEDTLGDLSPELLEEINDLSRSVINMIAEVHEEGVLEGKFVKGKSIAHADIAWAMFTGIVMWEEAKRKIDPRKDFLKPTLDKAFDIFLMGIKKHS